MVVIFIIYYRNFFVAFIFYTAFICMTLLRWDFLMHEIDFFWVNWNHIVHGIVIMIINSYWTAFYFLFSSFACSVGIIVHHVHRWHRLWIIRRQKRIVQIRLTNLNYSFDRCNGINCWQWPILNGMQMIRHIINAWWHGRFSAVALWEISSPIHMKLSWAFGRIRSTTFKWRVKIR